jgi:hypothetical protein
MSSESIALQKKMLGSFRTLGAGACSERAVDKMMIFAVITQVTKTYAELG